MTRYQNVLLGLSAVLAVLAIYLAGLPFPVRGADSEMYLHAFSFYFLAVIPPVLTTCAAHLVKERKWAYYTVLSFWSLAVLSTILCLLIWPTDAWAPVLWYTSSEGWLAGAVLLAFVAGFLRYSE